MPTPKKVVALYQLVQGAPGAMRSDNPDVIGTLIRQLEEAIDDVPGFEARELLVEAFGLLDQLRAREAALAGRAVQAAIDSRIKRLTESARACRECGGKELLVAERATIEMHGTGGHLTARVIVCRGCGDIRMRVANPESLRRTQTGTDTGFETITAPAKPDAGPYRPATSCIRAR
jgi:hypothetical protein